MLLKLCVLLLFAAFSTAAPLGGSAEYLLADGDQEISESNSYSTDQEVLLTVILTVASFLIPCIPLMLFVVVICLCQSCVYSIYRLYSPFNYFGYGGPGWLR
uniref:G_PROTEIN_RECEP_F1_2 domain-containing protein n=1 Tax=Steinernema glaseri TaxID=37863 RepID=A0A1I7YPR8_9BILA